MSLPEISGAAPWFGPLDPILDDIREVLESGVLVQGRHVVEFERRIAAMAGTPFAAAVNSGGTALELALVALNVKGGEVIVPTQTFIASANAVVRAGGTPVFADIERDTLCLDPAEVERLIGPATRGVMFVHMFGLVPPSLRRVEQLCRERGLFLIEDAAHAHGASLDGRFAGQFGDAGCFSFFATKVVTTGEGGAVTTSRADVHAAVVSLRNHGRQAGTTLYDLPGNNFRLMEIQSLLGVHQLAHLEQILDHRARIAAVYRSGLRGVAGIESLPEFPGTRHAYWRYPAYLAPGVGRAAFQQRLWDGHRIRITWMYEPPCHLQPVSQARGAQPMLPVAEWCIERLVNLPTHMGVSVADAARVVDAIASELAGAAR